MSPLAKPRSAVAAAALALAMGCGPAPEGTSEAPREEGARPAASAAPAAPAAPLVVFLGDSLTAGLGVAEPEAFPAVVGRRLAKEGIEVRVVNAGISGDTTAGGLARLDWLLGQRPRLLVVGLGANDGLRGLSLDETEANLRRIVSEARRAGVEVLLLGMLLPPNYGPDYTERFAAIYPRLAEELGVVLVPFLLDGVAGLAELNQADGIHPTAEGHRRMADNVWPELVALLEPAAG
jgi:acyl-CoA thioesterase-1